MSNPTTTESLFGTLRGHLGAALEEAESLPQGGGPEATIQEQLDGAREAADRIEGRVRQLEAERDRLREALKPFADAATVSDANDGGNWVPVYVSAGCCRRAREALATGQPKEPHT